MMDCCSEADSRAALGSHRGKKSVNTSKSQKTFIKMLGYSCGGKRKYY